MNIMDIKELKRIRAFNKMPDSFIDEKAYCGPKYIYESLRIFAQREGKTLLQMYSEMYEHAALREE